MIRPPPKSPLFPSPTLFRSRFFRRHAAAVVDHANQPPPAGIDLDVHAASARVDRVLAELFHDGGRSFDYLARGDLIRQLGREQDRKSTRLNSSHAKYLVCRL